VFLSLVFLARGRWSSCWTGAAGTANFSSWQ